MYAIMRQNKEKLASGEMTNDDIWVMAYDLADRKIEERLNVLRGKHYDKEQLAKEIQQYREEQDLKYRELFDWNGANDETTVKNILDVECNIYEVKRALSDVSLAMEARDKLYDRHTKLVMAHKDLLTAAGIDRLSREKKQTTAQPIEDWFRVKRAGHDKMVELERAFPLEAANCETEADLRDLIKYSLGYDFAVIDAILSSHRRTLGLPTEVEVAAA
jgi:hypothetical protein